MILHFIINQSIALSFSHASLMQTIVLLRIHIIHLCTFYIDKNCLLKLAVKCVKVSEREKDKI